MIPHSRGRDRCAPPTAFGPAVNELENRILAASTPITYPLPAPNLSPAQIATIGQDLADAVRGHPRAIAALQNVGQTIEDVLNRIEKVAPGFLDRAEQYAADLLAIDNAALADLGLPGISGGGIIIAA